MRTLSRGNYDQTGRPSGMAPLLDRSHRKLQGAPRRICAYLPLPCEGYMVMPSGWRRPA